jgi:hypothetical protein
MKIISYTSSDQCGIGPPRLHARHAACKDVSCTAWPHHREGDRWTYDLLSILDAFTIDDQDQTALVTGGTKGIGRAIVEVRQTPNESPTRTQ